MDILKVKSTLIRALVSKMISKSLQKNFGEMKVTVNDLDVEVKDDAKVHLDLSINISKEELAKVISRL